MGIKKKAKLVKPKESFSVPGEDETFHRGMLMSSNHPVYKGREHLFEDADSGVTGVVGFTDSETTDNTPGGKRQTSNISAAIRGEQNNIYDDDNDDNGVNDVNDVNDDNSNSDIQE